MPTIHDLSLEIIERIFIIAGEADGNKSLRAAALVCHAWTPTAQRVLWRVMRLTSTTASRLQLGWIVKYPIGELMLENTWQDAVPGPLTAGILAMVQGVRVLDLRGGGIDPGWLCTHNLRSEYDHRTPSIECSPAFADVKSLYLDLVLHRPTSTTFVLPFALTSLALRFGGGYDPTEPGGLPPALLEALARQPSIVSLKLACYGHSDDPYGLLIHLLPLAPQLITLDLSMGGERDNFIQRCTRLKYLSSSTRLGQITAPLEIWKIDGCYHDVVRRVLNILNASELGLTKPLRLELNMAMRPMLDGMWDYTRGACRRDMKRWAEGWDDLEEVCLRRKIKLVIARVGLFGGVG